MKLLKKNTTLKQVFKEDPLEIKKWDRIDINKIDNNSFELKVWEEIFVINIYN